MNLSTAIAAALLALAGAIVTFAVLAWWGRRQRQRSIARNFARTLGPGTASRRADPRQDNADRVQHDIEQRLHSLRRAREHAEHWVPPAVDAVGTKQAQASADAQTGWADTSFADTTFPDDEVQGPEAKPAA